MFSFGQDAELGGAKGNGEMAKAFAQRGVRFAWVLDEGSPIVNEPYPGVKHPVALLSVAEKGSLALELTAPNQTQLQSALRKVNALSFSSDLDAVQRAKLQVLAPFAPFGDRMKLANVWLLKPMVLGAIETNPQSAAALRTTILETKQPEAKESAGTGMARAVINFRLHQRDTIASVTERVKAAINDAKVEVKPLTEENNEASKAVDVNSPAYRLVAQAIGDTFRIPVAPELMNDRTDSRHYLDNADAVLRFRPFAVEPGDLERVKGANERIAVADLGAAAGFYLRLIQNSQ